MSDVQIRKKGIDSGIIWEFMMSLLIFAAAEFSAFVFYTQVFASELNSPALIVISLFAALIFMISRTKKAFRFLLPILCFLDIGVITLMMKEFSDGVRYLYNNYIAVLSEYQNVSVLYYNIDRAVDIDISAAFAFTAIFLLISVFIVIAVKMKQSLLLALCLLPAFLLCVFIGEFPGIECLLPAFAAILSTLAMKHGGTASAAPVFALASLVSLIVYFFIMPLLPASELHSRMTETRIRQDQLISDVRSGTVVGNIISGISGSFAPDASPLENRELNYSGEELMKLSMNIKPSSTIYLKTFSGGQYTGSSWEIGEEYEGSVNRDEIYNLLAASAIYEDMPTNIELHKTGYNGQYLPTPYYSVSNSELDFEQDFYCRNLYDNPVSFTGYPEVLILPDSSNSFVHANQYDVSGDYNYDVSLLPGETDANYSEYVRQNYLEVPEDLLPTLEEHLNDYVQKADSGEIEPASAREERIAEILDMAADYDINPPEIPENEDFCEYFLSTNKAGYCQHFASAGVMFFRAMGVPARYATGYAVSPDSFTGAGERWVASVIDSTAHAWVEIYADSYGWLPVEVTPAAESSNATASGTESENSESSSSTEENSEESGEESSSEPEESAVSLAPSVSEVPSVDDPTVGRPENYYGIILMIVSPVILLLLIFLLVKLRIGYVKTKRMNPKHLNILMKDLFGMYRYILGDSNITDAELLKKHRGILNSFSDEEFEELLDIIGKYEFSHEKLTGKDIQTIKKAYSYSRSRLLSSLNNTKYFVCNIIRCY